MRRRVVTAADGVVHSLGNVWKFKLPTTKFRSVECVSLNCVKILIARGKLNFVGSVMM